MIKSIGMYKKVLFFCSEGLPYIAVGLVLAIAVTVITYWKPHAVLIVLTIILWLLALEIGYFLQRPGAPPTPGTRAYRCSGRRKDYRYTSNG